MSMPDANGGSTLAVLTNVALCAEALNAAISRQHQLPGLLCLYGPAGWGKTSAAAYCANRYRAYFVAAKSVWSKKAFLGAILKEMGVSPARTISDMADQVAEQLAVSQRPLIVDEVDHLVAGNHIELVRDLFESSLSPILMIGEELLPAKLKKWERFHSRVLRWVPAQAATIEDAQHLRKMYCPQIRVADDLMDRIVRLANGSVRRIVVNFALVQEAALAGGVTKMDLGAWGERELYTGEAPVRRIAA